MISVQLDRLLRKVSPWPGVLMEVGTFPTWMIIPTDIPMELMDTIYMKGHIWELSVGVGMNNINFWNAKP